VRVSQGLGGQPRVWGNSPNRSRAVPPPLPAAAEKIHAPPPSPPNPHSPSPIPPSLISCSRHNPSQVSAAIDTGLPDDLAIKGVPALVPWGNRSSILIGSSNSVGTSVGRLKLGPCGYDVAHWHAQAWETITPITPGAPISCVFLSFFFLPRVALSFGPRARAPLGSLASRHALLSPSTSTPPLLPFLPLPTATIIQGPVPGSPQESFVTSPIDGATAVPTGYMHIDFNNNCITAEAVLVWNAINAGGTFPIPQGLFQLSLGYNQVAFVEPLPAPAGLWVVDAACAARCNLSASGDAKVAAALHVVDSAAAAARTAVLVKASAASTTDNKVKRMEANVMAKMG